VTGLWNGRYLARHRGAHDADCGVELGLNVLIQRHVFGCRCRMGDSIHGAIVIVVGHSDYVLLRKRHSIKSKNWRTEHRVAVRR
jgi:hypothetical protein